MPQFPIGRYGASVTIRGLFLTGTINGYSLRMDLTAQEAMDLLQVLYNSRDTLYLALHPEQYMNGYPCPTCGTLIQLKRTATGYAGACHECANDFFLNMSGVLVSRGSGQSR